MRLLLRTPVAQPPTQVWQGFNQDLFLALAPPFPPVKLRRFDGSLTGDEVHIELNLLFTKQLWVSQITEHHQAAEEIFFVDQGIRLPFFLASWRHRHGIKRHGSGSLIEDDITYTAPAWLPDGLLYPTLWLQFAYRRPVYQRLFGKPTGA
jgi:ligand-binding SRPBCC domain-containing protein